MARLYVVIRQWQAVLTGLSTKAFSEKSETVFGRKSASKQNSGVHTIIIKRKPLQVMT
jgi:hypothetical protein